MSECFASLWQEAPSLIGSTDRARSVCVRVWGGEHGGSQIGKKQSLMVAKATISFNKQTKHYPQGQKKVGEAVKVPNGYLLA